MRSTIRHNTSNPLIEICNNQSDQSLNQVIHYKEDICSLKTAQYLFSLNQIDQMNWQDYAPTRIPILFFYCFYSICHIHGRASSGGGRQRLIILMSMENCEHSTKLSQWLWIHKHSLWSCGLLGAKSVQVLLYQISAVHYIKCKLQSTFICVSPLA